MIDLSTDEGIRQAFREIADWPTPAPADSSVTMLRSPRSRRFDEARRANRSRRLVTAAAAVLVVAGAVGLVARRDGGDPVAHSPRGWSAMADSPLSARFAPSVVWDGDEMLVWGGYDTDGTSLIDGAAYRPTTNTWRPIAPMTTGRAPAASPPQAVPDLTAWVGGEAVSIVASDGDPWGWDVVAYDPETDDWRTIEQNRYDQLPTDELVPTAGAAPIHQPYAAAGWRDQLVVVGWRSDLSLMGWARLDPTTGTWSPFTPLSGSEDAYGMRNAPGSPTIIDDRYLVMMTSGQLTDNPFGYRIDLVENTSIPLDVPADVGAFNLSISLAGDGTIIGVTTDEEGQSKRFATRLDAASGTFSAIAAAPRGPVEHQAPLIAIPGGYVSLGGLDVDGVTMGGLRSESVHLSASAQVDGWTNLPKPPIDLDRIGHAAIWTGREVLVWGGATAEFAGPSNLATIPLRDGAVYRP